jgi:hypothetical protein
MMWKYGDKYVIYRLKVHMIGYYRSADREGSLYIYTSYLVFPYNLIVAAWQAIALYQRCD